MIVLYLFIFKIFLCHGPNGKQSLLCYECATRSKNSGEAKAGQASCNTEEDTQSIHEANDAEYKRLHCHEIVLHSKSGDLKACVWNEDCLELRRRIIEKYNETRDHDQEEHGYEDDEGGGEWQKGGYDWSLSGGVRTQIITEKEEIEALINDKKRFMEYCLSIMPCSPDDFCFMIPEVQRSIEAREIVVEFEMKECCQGTTQHANLLEMVEDYCRDLFVFCPTKMLMTIKASVAEEEMDSYLRCREMIEFYKDRGYRLLPWEFCVSDGWGGRNVGAFSKHLVDPALDIDRELFYS
jgi:hypothetical protein